MGKLPIYTPYQPSQAVPAPRVRSPPRVPFFKDPAHTVPTRWSLYRPLVRALKGPAPLRASVPPAAVAIAASYSLSSIKPPVVVDTSVQEALAAQERVRASTSTFTSSRTTSAEGATSSASSSPSPSCSFLSSSGAKSSTSALPTPCPSTRSAAYPFLLDAVRARWRHARDLTSVPSTRAFLTTEMSILDRVRSTSSSSSSLEEDATAFASQVAARLASDAAVAAERAVQKARPPFLTGGFMRGTLFNPPMPRMKPQPERISVMIRSRALRRTRRITKDRRADEEMEDMRREIAFWRRLGVDSTQQLGDWSSSSGVSWETEYLNYKRLLGAQFDLEAERGMALFTPEQMGAVKEARRRRHRYRVNSAREKAGLGPLFDAEGSKIEGADEQFVLPFDEGRWLAAKARREAARK